MFNLFSVVYILQLLPSNRCNNFQNAIFIYYKNTLSYPITAEGILLKKYRFSLPTSVARFHIFYLETFNCFSNWSRSWSHGFPINLGNKITSKICAGSFCWSLLQFPSCVLALITKCITRLSI